MTPEYKMNPLTQPLEKKTVLVVDDEPDIVDILTSYLEDEGYCVIAAYDGQEGLEKAHAIHPHLIILDFMLPLKHGLTFCKELKEETALSSIPVLLLTGTGRGDTVGTALRLGINAYLPKPFERQALLSIVRRLIASDVSSSSA